MDPYKAVCTFEEANSFTFLTESATKYTSMLAWPRRIWDVSTVFLTTAPRPIGR